MIQEDYVCTRCLRDELNMTPIFKVWPFETHIEKCNFCWRKNDMICYLLKKYPDDHTHYGKYIKTILPNNSDFYFNKDPNYFNKREQRKIKMYVDGIEANTGILLYVINNKMKNDYLHLPNEIIRYIYGMIKRIKSSV